MATFTTIMPHIFSFTGHGHDDVLQRIQHEALQKQPPPRRPSLLKNIGSLLRRHHEVEPSLLTAPVEQPQSEEYFPARRRSMEDGCPATRRAVPSLPRPLTFCRQESEQRAKLLQTEPSSTEKRGSSVGRRRGLSASAAKRPSSPSLLHVSSMSAPHVATLSEAPPSLPFDQQPVNTDAERSLRKRPELPSLEIPDQFDHNLYTEEQDDEHDIDRTSLQEEYDRRWILNLSMHFRDHSNREKFFVTYAETPSKWRRLTISLDYRHAPLDSLEADLSTLHYQRDKSFRIYEAIRESLPDVQYYDTVTNLKLETTPEDGQLHVHVREDANEIVRYPATSLFAHIHTRMYTEDEVEFSSHLSGFVYKVHLAGEGKHEVIKKEIPGPDTVDEFLYEVNALASLRGSPNIVQLEGLVTDPSGSVVKGLLISYASHGALVDLLYDARDAPRHQLPWHCREKWARQIVQGLSDIHEAGFVQGDFTLSNIVVDEEDDARIIDINRRGCPVGWEPPELGRLIDSGQRIGMCIGVKTDLFQLGMVLWALAEVIDEPEREPQPLAPVNDALPPYFRQMVATCLSEYPQNRRSAQELLHSFPATAGQPPPLSTSPTNQQPSTDFPDPLKLSSHSTSTSSHSSEKLYIDSSLAATLEEPRPPRADSHTRTSASDSPCEEPIHHVAPASKAAASPMRYDFDECAESWILGHERGRSPVTRRWRRTSLEEEGESASSGTSGYDGLEAGMGVVRRVSRDEGPECLDGLRGRRGGREGEAVEGGEGGEVPSRRVSESAECGGWKAVDDGTTPVRAPPALTEKLWELAARAARLAELVHTDSGFDEQMLDTEEEVKGEESGKGCLLGQCRDDDDDEHDDATKVTQPTTTTTMTKTNMMEEEDRGYEDKRHTTAMTTMPD